MGMTKTYTFQPGDRVRYVGQLTDRDVNATIEEHDDTPPGKVSLRLKNGLRFFADPADCLGSVPLVWPFAFPENAQ